MADGGEKPLPPGTNGAGVGRYDSSPCMENISAYLGRDPSESEAIILQYAWECGFLTRENLNWVGKRKSERDK